VLLLVLGHIDANHGLLVVEQEFGERARQARPLPTPSAQEDEAAERPVRVLQAPRERGRIALEEPP